MIPSTKAKEPSSLYRDQCRGLVLCELCGRQAQIRQQRDERLCYLCDTEQRIANAGGAVFIAEDERIRDYRFRHHEGQKHTLKPIKRKAQQ